MKDTLITISNELLDDVNDLSPTRIEKLRQDRFVYYTLSLLFEFLCESQARYTEGIVRKKKPVKENNGMEKKKKLWVSRLSTIHIELTKLQNIFVVLLFHIHYNFFIFYK